MKRYKIVRHKYEWSSRAKIERKQGRRNFEKIKAKISPKTAKTYINPQTQRTSSTMSTTHTHIHKDTDTDTQTRWRLGERESAKYK